METLDEIQSQIMRGHYMSRNGFKREIDVRWQDNLCEHITPVHKIQDGDEVQITVMRRIE